MKKKLTIGLLAGFVIAVVVTIVKNRPTGPPPDMWSKMREKMEEMPDDFPPRVMFDNVEATRANTDEILSLLRRERTDADVVSSN